VQDVDAALRYMASLLKLEGRLMHVFPCGNPGSLEFRLVSLIDGGIGMRGLFALDDSSHVSRLTSAELEQLCRRAGLLLREAFFANQFWGGIDYLTGIYHGTTLEWLRTFRGADAWSSTRLFCVLALLLFVSLIRNGPRYVFATYGHRRAVWKRAVYSAALPFAALAYPVSRLISTLLEGARNREWRLGKTRPNASEAYLIFEKR
jgi:hypothetical protein